MVISGNSTIGGVGQLCFQPIALCQPARCPPAQWRSREAARRQSIVRQSFQAAPNRECAREVVFTEQQLAAR